MHAVFGTVNVEAARHEEADAFLKNTVVPMARQAPGFVSGTWLLSPDHTEGTYMLIFDSEANAQGSIDRMAKREGLPVTVTSMKLLEVQAQA